MAKFGETHGTAIKDSAPKYAVKNGDNRLRLVGDILPRYVYWIKGTKNKDIPMECLAFDRDAERFLNREKDWVKSFYPDLQCSWAYAINCIDYSEETPKVVVFNLKKKLFEQIKNTAEDLGDPTDPESGWDVYFKRTKTGAAAFNVEYMLQVAKCMAGKRPLTPEEVALVNSAKSITEVTPRPGPEDQKNLLDRIRSESNTANNDAAEMASEFPETN